MDKSLMTCGYKRGSNELKQKGLAGAKTLAWIEKFKGVLEAKTMKEYKEAVMLAMTRVEEEDVSVEVLKWLTKNMPKEFNETKKYTLLVFLLKTLPWELPDELAQPKDRLRGRKELYWSNNYIHLDSLPSVRFIEFKGEIKLIDDVRLGLLILQYVPRLPLFLYSPVKLFTHKHLPETFKLMFVAEDLPTRTIKETKCEECGKYDRSVQPRPIWGQSLEKLFRVCDECAKKKDVMLHGVGVKRTKEVVDTVEAVEDKDEPETKVSKV